MSRIASLPWYDLPQARASTDQFWSTLACAMHDHGIVKLPELLDRLTPLELQWCNSHLLISQCCGPDLFTKAASQLQVVARPIFSDLDCTPGCYFSHIVSNHHYSQGPARLIVNSLSSRSGNSALIEWCKAQDIGTQSLNISGSHQASLQALLSGQADLAAIDAHSWNLLQVKGINVVGMSTQAATPPYVTHKNNTAQRQQVFDALTQAISVSGHLLGVSAIISADKVDYEPTRIEELKASA